MRILTVNCGSSSLKTRLCDVSTDSVTDVISADVESIGTHAVLSVRAKAHTSRTSSDAGDYASALNLAVDAIVECDRGAIDRIGHRVVQGAPFTQPSLIDERVTQAIEAATRIAPLHNGPSLAGIQAARDRFGSTPMVAVFDTAFHSTLPPVASTYALPHEFAEKHGVRRYGYHGIAHRSLVERYAELTSTSVESVLLVTLQLGNGSSATAVRSGASVDTSMGFTPIEGLVMGTRPGDVDAGALIYLLREGAIGVAELDDMLNHGSGLLGVSGISSDVPALLEAAGAGDARARAAIDLFCYRARKYIGAYFAALGDVQAVVFGGGISRSAQIRRQICEPLGPLGVRLDSARNDGIAEGEGIISEAASRVSVWHISTDEERVIARDTYDALVRTPE